MSARGRAGAARPPEVFCLLAVAVAPPAGRAPRPGPSPAAARPASAPIAAVPPLPPAPPPGTVGALCLGWRGRGDGGRRRHHIVRPPPGAPESPAGRPAPGRRFPFKAGREGTGPNSPSVLRAVARSGRASRRSVARPHRGL